MYHRCTGGLKEINPNPSRYSSLCRPSGQMPKRTRLYLSGPGRCRRPDLWDKITKGCLIGSPYFIGSKLSCPYSMGHTLFSILLLNRSRSSLVVILKFVSSPRIIAIFIPAMTAGSVEPLIVNIRSGTSRLFAS